MKDIISNKVQNIEITGIRKFYNKVMEVPGTISLTLGQPDFPVPTKIKHSMIKAIEAEKTTYTANAGIVQLREEISLYLKNYENIHYNKEEICVTVGGSEGIFSVFTTILNPYDKVLIPEIAYPAYESCVKILGGQTIAYKLKDDFTPDLDELETLILKEKPKVIVISYPSNPTGAILSKENCRGLYNIIKNNDILVLTDEIYSALCFEEEYYSLAQYEDIRDKIILVSGFSKMFSMTGLRIGYVCATEPIMKNLIKTHQYAVSCAPSIVQWGACEGLKNCMKDVDNMKVEFIKRKDFLYNRLKSLGFEVNMPQGAFYMFPSIKHLNIRCEEFCERLLKEGKVAVIPGTAFGKGGEGFVRISYSYSMEELKEGTDRLEEWLRRNLYI